MIENVSASRRSECMSAAVTDREDASKQDEVSHEREKNDREREKIYATLVYAIISSMNQN